MALPESAPDHNVSGTVAIWLAIPACQILFWLYSMPGPQLNGHGGFSDGVMACLVSVVTLFLIPALVASLAGIPLRDLGVAMGDRRLGWLAVLVVGPLFVIGTLIGSRDQGIQAFYPVSGDLIGQSGAALLVWLGFYLLYYISFEFFYRGFLLRVFESRGMLFCIGLQSLFCFLIHIGKPEAELWASLPASVVFGWIAWKSRSIWYGVIIHFLVGIANDLGALWQTGRIDW